MRSCLCLLLSLCCLVRGAAEVAASAPPAPELQQRMTQLVWDITAELQRLESCHRHPDPFRARIAAVYADPEFAALRGWFRAAGVILPPALPPDALDAQPTLEACVDRVDRLLATLDSHRDDIRSLPQAAPPAANDVDAAGPAGAQGTDPP